MHNNKDLFFLILNIRQVFRKTDVKVKYSNVNATDYLSHHHISIA
jgi:hypothetical protein